MRILPFAFKRDATGGVRFRGRKIDPDVIAARTVFLIMTPPEEEDGGRMVSSAKCSVENLALIGRPGTTEDTEDTEPGTIFGRKSLGLVLEPMIFGIGERHLLRGLSVSSVFSVVPISRRVGFSTERARSL